VRLESAELSEETLRGTDCAVILTDHDGVDYDRLVRTVPLVVDTRNATRRVQSQREKVVPA